MTYMVVTYSYTIGGGNAKIIKEDWIWHSKYTELINEYIKKGYSMEDIKLREDCEKDCEAAREEAVREGYPHMVLTLECCVQKLSHNTTMKRGGFNEN